MKKNLWKKAGAGILSAALVLTICPLAEKAFAATGQNTASLYAYENQMLETVGGLKTAARDDDEITLTWNGVSGADGYEIYQYSKTSGTWALKERTTKTRCEIEDLTEGRVYTFKVRAYRKNNWGADIYGNFSDNFSTATEAEDVDDLRTTRKTTTSITLKWDSAKGADGYQLYRRSTSGSQWIRIADTTKTSYTVTGLSSGKQYRFKVRAYHEALGYRYYSDFEYLKTKTRGVAADTSGNSSGFITKAEAKSIALKRAGVSAAQATFTKVEKDREDGVYVYEIEFEAGDYEYDVEVNARTGNIRDYEKESIWD